MNEDPFIAFADWAIKESQKDKTMLHTFLRHVALATAAGIKQAVATLRCQVVYLHEGRVASAPHGEFMESGPSEGTVLCIIHADGRATIPDFADDEEVKG